MLRTVSGRLTYSNVVASLALFIALGGVGYAAVKLPKNSVGRSQIKKNAVIGSKVRTGSLTGSDVRNSSLTGSDVRNSSLTGSDVRNSSLTGSDVRNSSLTGSDVRNSSLTGTDVKDGSLSAKDFSGSVQGAPGPPGPPGPPGAKGDPFDELPSGRTLKGVYDVGGTATGAEGSLVQHSISFAVPLPADPTAHVVASGGTPPAACAGGTPAAPRADPGHLCVFEQLGSNRAAIGPDNITDPTENAAGKGDRTGFGIFVQASGSPAFFGSRGGWAATAP